MRDSGEPYMVHPLMVAHILADMRMDLVAIETGLLHDVVEDTSVTVDEIRKEFGDEVARCVDGVTKLSKLDFFSAEERQAESFRKMLLAMVDDIRVIIVKLADRLHNMRTLGYLSRRAPRAHRAARPSRSTRPSRTAWAWAKSAASWKTWRSSYLEPEACAEIAAATSNPAPLRTKNSSNEIRHDGGSRICAREGIPARVEGRVKRPYSVYQKLKRQKIALDQVYDLLALRIITDSVKNCYAALGVIHNEWRPIPGRIKDFIAIPRPNLYQSLHTSVVGPRRADTSKCRSAPKRCTASPKKASRRTGNTRKARKGPAADDQRIAWLRQLVEWQRDMQRSRRVHVHAQSGSVPGRSLHLHAAGKVIVLPRDATPIDFAYAIHSDVGNTCVGAKVNGRIVPLQATRCATATSWRS